MAENKKPFFRQPLKGKVKAGKFVPLEELGGRQNLEELLGTDYYTVLPCMIPEGFLKKGNPSKFFMKHGTELKNKRFDSIPEALQYGRLPFEIRNEEMDSLSDMKSLPIYSGYSEKPWGVDSRTRRIPLTSCISGARIIAFANQIKNEEIKIRPYNKARRVSKDGGEFVLQVPSETQCMREYGIRISSVPLFNNEKKHLLSRQIDSDHVCENKRYMIRFDYKNGKEGNKAVNFCGHDIAGYLSIIDYCWNEENNKTPLEMSLFALPTQKTVNHYLALERNVLVKDRYVSTKDKLRKPKRADFEIELWRFVQNQGSHETFFPVKEKDGKIQDYDWRV